MIWGHTLALQRCDLLLFSLLRPRRSQQRSTSKTPEGLTTAPSRSALSGTRRHPLLQQKPSAAMLFRSHVLLMRLSLRLQVSADVHAGGVPGVPFLSHHALLDGL